MKTEDEIKNDKTYIILIVDDEREILSALSGVLKTATQFRCEISTAENGNIALDELKKKEFDLVLSDYKMPDMNGVELLTKVRQEYPRTVRILITGYSDMKIAKDAINKAEVHYYIEKPWNNEELQMMIHEVLRRKENRDSQKTRTVDTVKNALILLNELRKEVPSVDNISTQTKTITFEFDSVAEFNRLIFEIKRMKNVLIEDLHVFENKHIISVSVYPEAGGYIKVKKEG